MRSFTLILVLLALLGIAGSAAYADTSLGVGMAVFPGAKADQQATVGADLSQSWWSWHDAVGSADLLMLTNGKVAGGLGLNAKVAPAFKVAAAYAANANHSDFCWRNLLGAVIYTPKATTTANLANARYVDDYRLGTLRIEGLREPAMGLTFTRRF